VDLVDRAVQSGIFNDLGSGSNVDICVISKSNGVTMLRNYKTPNARLFRAELPSYKFKRGTTGAVCSVSPRFPPPPYAGFRCRVPE